MAKKIQQKPISNLIDYVYNFGICPFSELPFVINDAFVFSAVSYLPFENCNIKVGDTLQDLCIKLLGKLRYKKQLDSMQMDRVFLCLALVNSDRFSKLKIVNMKNVLSNEKTTQYAAIAFADEKNLFINFRGTDNTLIGWQEDLYMACYDTLFSHELAIDFLEETLKENAHVRNYVCGHSKGGNLALHSSSMAAIKYQKMITNVISIDGPGLLKEIFSSEGHQRIESRVIHITPQDCVIGALLHHENIAYVAKSYPDKDMINQHDLYSFETSGIGLVELKDRTSLSYVVEISLDEFLTKLGKKDKRVDFVNALFQAIYDMGIKDSDEIFKNPYGFMRNFLFLNRKKSKDKTNLNKMLREFMSIFSRNLMTYKKDKTL